jgi:hypothetical protein
VIRIWISLLLTYHPASLVGTGTRTELIFIKNLS